MRTAYPSVVIPALAVLALLGLFFLLGGFHLFPLGSVLGFLARISGYEGEGISHEPSMAASVALVLVGVVLLAAGLFGIISFRLSPREKGTICLQGPLGRITIPVSRIEDSIRRATVRVTGVDHAEVNVSQEGSGLGAEVSVTLSLDRPIPVVSSDVQDAIQQELADVLGQDQVKEIEVRVAEYRRHPRAQEQREVAEPKSDSERS